MLTPSGLGPWENIDGVFAWCAPGAWSQGASANAEGKQRQQP